MNRRGLSVTLKIYAIGIPLALISGVWTFATVTSYYTTSERIDTARQEIAAALAAQIAERESNEMILHALTFVLDEDRNDVRAIERAERAANVALDKWVALSRAHHAMDPEDLRTQKHRLDREVAHVIAAVHDGQPAAGRAALFDTVLPQYDDELSDDLHEAVRIEEEHLSEALVRLAGVTGRAESFFGDKLTVRIEHAQDDLAQAQAGSTSVQALTAGSYETISHIYEGDPPLEEVLDERADSRRLIESWGAVFARAGEADEVAEGGQIDRILGMYDDLSGIEDQALDLASTHPAGARTILAGDYENTLGRVRAEAKAVIEHEVAEVESTIASISQEARRIHVVTSAIAIALFLGGTSFVVILSRRISRRLKRLTRAATIVGEGDLDIRVPADTPDEFGALADAFNAMANKVRQSRDRDEWLLAQTMTSAEQERTQLAAELHDGPVQRLTAIAYTVERCVNAAKREDHASVASTLDSVRSEIRSEIADLRRLMMGLRPPALDERGLASAISDYVTDFSERYNVRVAYDIIGEGRLAPEVETTVYRVVQEALTNIAKHAEASFTCIRIEHSDAELTLSITDDGRGFDRDATGPDGLHHYGIDGMTYRVRMVGGVMTIASGLAGGTVVSATIPLDVRQVA